MGKREKEEWGKISEPVGKVVFVKKEEGRGRNEQNRRVF